jgi:hypothetical protein
MCEANSTGLWATLELLAKHHRADAMTSAIYTETVALCEARGTVPGSRDATRPWLESRLRHRRAGHTKHGLRIGLAFVTRVGSIIRSGQRLQRTSQDTTV